MAIIVAGFCDLRFVVILRLDNSSLLYRLDRSSLMNRPSVETVEPFWSS